MAMKLHNPNTLKPSTILSYAVQVGDTVFTSGLTPRDPVTGAIVEGGIRVQAGTAFDNLKRVLDSLGASATDVVKMTVYLTDMNDATEMNDVYRSFFEGHRPARTTVEVSGLTPGMVIEIEAIVVMPP